MRACIAFHVVVSFSGDTGGLSASTLPAHLFTSTRSQGKFCLNLVKSVNYACVILVADFPNLSEWQAALAQFVKYETPAFRKGRASRIASDLLHCVAMQLGNSGGFRLHLTQRKYLNSVSHNHFNRLR
jgi:hypothetical protein